MNSFKQYDILHFSPIYYPGGIATKMDGGGYIYVEKPEGEVSTYKVVTRRIGNVTPFYDVYLESLIINKGLKLQTVEIPIENSIRPLIISQLSSMNLYTKISKNGIMVEDNDKVRNIVNNLVANARPKKRAFEIPKADKLIRE